MKINIKEDGETISALVSVEPLKGKNRSSQKRKIFHKDVLDYLATQNIKVGPCLKSPPLVTNLMGPEQLSGEWIFEKVKPPPPKKITPPKKNPKKVKKTLDKSPEDVIIYIQEETLPSKED